MSGHLSDVMAELAHAVRDVTNCEAAAACATPPEGVERALLQAHAVLVVTALVAVESHRTDVYLRKQESKAATREARLEALLAEVREALAERQDTVDTNDGPSPNWAMRLVGRIEEACA